MNIDFKTITITVGVLVIAIAAVVFVTAQRSGAPVLTEIIPFAGVPSSERTLKGLQLQVRNNELAISVPGCDISKYPDKFFLHIYFADANTKPKTPFVNFDFDLANEKAVETSVAGYKTCTYIKSYKDYAVGAISFGQFAQIDNKCCTLKWSRFYAFRADFPLYEDANGLISSK